MKKILTLFALALFAGCVVASAQEQEQKVEAVGQSDFVVVTLEDGSRELYRPATRYWNDDPVFAYRYCKKRYGTDGYVSNPLDPYNPFVSGILGVLCPGLGHVYDGEVLRSMGFFYGTMLTAGLASAFLSEVDQERYDPQYGYIYKRNQAHATLGSLFALGAVGLFVWNIFDAVKVAKVKNLYFRDLVGRPDGLGIDIRPRLDFRPDGNPVAGVGLQLKF